MKKVVRLLILSVMVILMLCVWPFCFVRKTAEVSSNVTALSYGITEQFICHDIPYVQSFAAQTSQLEYIDFKFSHEQDISMADGRFYIQLLDENNKVVLTKEISFQDKKDYFWHVDIKQRIKKGKIYKFRITVDEQHDFVFKGFFTLTGEDHAPGSEILCMGEEIVDGQGLVRYGYGYALNIKNVICIWAFLLTIGFSMYACCGGIFPRNLPKKILMIWDGVWSLLHKYQMLVLIAEMLGILFLMTCLCRSNSLNWDESFSNMMVTKLSLVEMLHTTALDMHPPLYYLLLRGFTAIFGTEFLVMKLMSVVLSGCIMLLSITLIRNNWGAKVAFLFNLVIGLGPQFVFNGINVRMYELTLFFVTWSALLAYEIIQKSGKGKWILFVSSSLGGVYSHYFAVVPLTLIYGYLLIGLFKERRKECKYFFWCCVATIACYAPWIVFFFADTKKGADAIMGHLPWLASVLHSFPRDANGLGINLSKVDFGDLMSWLFYTNIKLSTVMGIVLLISSVTVFMLCMRHSARKKRLFLIMCATTWLISYFLIALFASTNTHFFDNRYIYDALGCLWLFIIIVFTDRGKVVSCCMAVYLTVFVLSAFTIQNSVEEETKIYAEHTYRVLQQVQGEIVLYNYPNNHIIYGTYLPEQEFVFVDEMDWENYEKDYIYFISWWGELIPQEMQEKYQMTYVDCGTMNFETGYYDANLFRVELQR